MKSNVANVTTIMKTAYYLLTASADDMPVAIDMTIIGCGWKKELTVPLEHCHADALARKCPLLRFPNRKAKDAFDATLISNLIAGLADGSIQRGYYFEQAGANILPSGQICFVHGSEVIGACGRPYKVAPEISNTQLLGQGRPLFQLPSILANAPYQVLLVLAYVILASIRSLLISAGIDLQAVQYIVGGQGLGKTTLATRVAGIYQAAGKPAGIVQAGSTHAAVNALMTNLRDQPVIVDDLCLSASRDTARKRIDLASKLIRQATGDIPIIKQSGKTTIELPCKTGLIITAEFHLENLSDLTRCIIVPVQKQLDISDELTPDLIADAVRHYLLWFTEHAYDEIGRFRVAMDHAVNNSDLDARMATNYACLDEAFRSFIRSMDGLEIPSRLNALMDKAMSKAVGQHQEMIAQLKDSFPVGNLSFCLLEGYKNDAFSMAKKVEKLSKHDGIIWRGDLCLRKEALIQFIRQQSGYHDWTANQITRTLKDINAFVLQEENAATVHLVKEHDVPRVYRLRMDILKETAQKF